MRQQLRLSGQGVVPVLHVVATPLRAGTDARAAPCVDEVAAQQAGADAHQFDANGVLRRCQLDDPAQGHGPALGGERPGRIGPGRRVRHLRRLQAAAQDQRGERSRGIQLDDVAFLFGLIRAQARPHAKVLHGIGRGQCPRCRQRARERIPAVPQALEGTAAGVSQRLATIRGRRWRQVRETRLEHLGDDVQQLWRRGADVTAQDQGVELHGPGVSTSPGAHS